MHTVPATIFVGQLPRNTIPRDLEDIFKRYGTITWYDLKKGHKKRYGFVRYEDTRNAEVAINKENGREMRGSIIVVEWAHEPQNRAQPSHSRIDRQSSRSSSYDRPNSRRNQRSQFRSAKSLFKVIVS